MDLSYLLFDVAYGDVDDIFTWIRLNNKANGETQTEPAAHPNPAVPQPGAPAWRANSNA